MAMTSIVTSNKLQWTIKYIDPNDGLEKTARQAINFQPTATEAQLEAVAAAVQELVMYAFTKLEKITVSELLAN